MSDTQQKQLPVWILTWKMVKGGRGRKHTAVFIPNASFVNQDPLKAGECKGTVYHVRGAPTAGFILEIRRNWDSAKSAALERALKVAWVSQKHVWVPTMDSYIDDDNHSRSDLDKAASNVRPPGPSTRLWIAEEIFDCQDWVVWFVEHIIQRRYISVEALPITKIAMDAKAPLMPASGGSSTGTRQPAPLALESPMTASTLRGTLSTTQQRDTDVSRPATGRPRIGASQWNAQRSRLERYNHATEAWEYLNSQRAWVKFA